MKINFLKPNDMSPLVAIALAAAFLPIVPTHDVFSSTLGPKLTVNAAPASREVGQGGTFSYSVTAEDPEGIDRIEITVNGARIKICPASSCEFTTNYWTNNLPKRDVTFVASAFDKSGYMNRSETLTLTIKDVAPAIAPSTTVAPVNAPNVEMTKDEASGISHKTWVNPTNKILNEGEKGDFNLQAKSATGLDHADIWVNGLVATVCRLSGSDSCVQSIDSKNFPAGTEIFVNADIHDKQGANVWTPGIRIQRPVPGAAPTQVSTQGTISLIVTPSKEIRRGTMIAAKTTAKNSRLGLARIDMYLNDVWKNSCSFGAAASEVTCQLDVDTSTFTEGSLLTFGSRAVDANGNDQWSNEQTVVIGADAFAQTQTQTGAYLSAHADRTDVALGETVNYIARGWSPNSGERITLYRGDKIIANCPSDICQAKIVADGQPIELHAKLIDNVLREIQSAKEIVTNK